VSCAIRSVCVLIWRRSSTMQTKLDSHPVTLHGKGRVVVWARRTCKRRSWRRTYAMDSHPAIKHLHGLCMRCLLRRWRRNPSNVPYTLEQNLHSNVFLPTRQHVTGFVCCSRTRKATADARSKRSTHSMGMGFFPFVNNSESA
jgi:hypothetical protein